MKPFSEWTEADVQAHNARVGRKEVTPINSQDNEIARIRRPESSEQVGAKSSQFVIHTDPVPAPRMTKRDSYRVTAKYPRRPCVARYFAFQDTLQRAVGDLPIVPDEVHCVFHVPMPDSWPKSKRQRMIYAPHKQRGDGDNFLKAVLDSLFLQDGGVWKGSFEKHWSDKGRVELTMVWR